MGGARHHSSQLTGPPGGFSAKVMNTASQMKLNKTAPRNETNTLVAEI